jgi:hypothetical protein
MTTETIAECLNMADLALTNAVQPEIALLLAAYSYDAARLAEGRALWNVARQLLSQRALLYGKQQDLTCRLDQARRAAYDELKTLSQLARAIFSHQPGLRVQLGLAGSTPCSTAGLLRASGTLFDNAADPAVALPLAAHSYTAERLAEMQIVFQTLRQASEAREAARGAAQQATQELRAALRALDRWMSQFRAVARVALRDCPQYLEELGISVRS